MSLFLDIGGFRAILTFRGRPPGCLIDAVEAEVPGVGGGVGIGGWVLVSVGVVVLFCFVLAVRGTVIGRLLKVGAFVVLVFVGGVAGGGDTAEALVLIIGRDVMESSSSVARRRMLSPRRLPCRACLREVTFLQNCLGLAVWLGV